MAAIHTQRCVDPGHVPRTCGAAANDASLFVISILDFSIITALFIIRLVVVLSCVIVPNEWRGENWLGTVSIPYAYH